MRGKYEESVECLVSRGGSLSATSFRSKLSQLESHLRKRNFDFRKEIDRISYKTSSIESSLSCDVPSISREAETLLFLTSASFFYESQILRSEHEKKRYDDLRQFEGEILQKYKKQNERLKALQKYTSEVQSRISSASEAKSKEREDRKKETISVLERYESYIQSEQQMSIEDEIKSSSMKKESVKQSIETSQNENKELLQHLETKKRTNSLNEEEMNKLEISVRSQLNKVEEEENELKGNIKSTEANIQTMQKQILELQEESKELDFIIEYSHNISPFIEQANQYKDIFSSSET